MKASYARHEKEREEVMIPPVARSTAEIKPFPGETIQTVMDPRVYKIALACWVCFLGVFWATFWINTNAMFMVVIATGYAAIFFGVPYLMSRQVLDRPAPVRSLVTFLRRPLGTLNGTMHGWEALLQVILVPLCLTCGGVAIGIIIRAARVVH